MEEERQNNKEKIKVNLINNREIEMKRSKKT